MRRTAALAARAAVAAIAAIAIGACTGQINQNPSLGDNPVPLPAPSCDAVNRNAVVSAPRQVAALSDQGGEAWQGSPAVVDVDGDGIVEILAPRHRALVGWHLDGSVVFRVDTDARIWAPPVVADLDPNTPGLEIAAASGDRIHAWYFDGTELPGFPATWQNELRTLAAGDVNGDGGLDLVAVSTQRLEVDGQRDVILAVDAQGVRLPGFPPNTSGSSGCDDACYPTGGFDQNLALGDVDGDGIVDIVSPHDNAYISVHDGAGRAFDAAEMFTTATKIQGVRFLHELADAQQGYADDEDTANQAHFTNTAPAVADLDGDGVGDIVMLGSVQNASQTDRERGVGLWAVHADGTRLDGWTAPLHIAEFLAGLRDYDGTNIVAASQEVAVVELDPDRAGPEIVFAGFEGRVHGVDARGQQVWNKAFTGDDDVLTGGVAVADLSGDGVPEIVFTTYSTQPDKSALYILDAGGSELHRVPLPGRGAMPVPTIADADGDGQLEIVVSLKDAGEAEVLVFTVDGSSTNCAPWPTGRGNLRRDGYVPAL